MRSASFSRLPAAVYVLFIRVYLYVCGVYVRFLMCSASAFFLFSQTRRVFFALRSRRFGRPSLPPFNLTTGPNQ